MLFINKNLTINELLNLYLKKNNKLEYIDKYDDYYRFIYNVLLLNDYKEKTINEFKIFDKDVITVILPRNVIGSFNL